MEKPRKPTFSLLEIRKNQILPFVGVALVLVGLVYLLVWVTGGIRYAFSHTMYIPIVLTGLLLGRKWGIFIAIVAGIALGPLMPYETTITPFTQQAAINWIFRLVAFTLLGFTSGLVSDDLRKKNATISKLFSINPETNIPNINHLTLVSQDILKPTNYFIASILVNNHEAIIDLLGTDTYLKLLKKIYLRLDTQIKENKIIVQADNNKFWVLQSNIEVRKDAEEILQILKEPLTVDEVPVYVEFSMGIDILWNRTSLNELSSFKQADVSARYAQKNNLNYVVFDQKKFTLMNDFELLGLFSSALKNNETYLVYQPKFDLETLEIVGVEALIRWEHEEKGMIMPDRFVPLVENTQLIHQLTEWVFEQALVKAQELEEHDIELSISINISPKNLLDPFFVQKITDLMKKTIILPKNIEFEITETALMSNPDECKSVLLKLRELGFRISIDDFGKGHSSLSYLMQFPFTTIKLDQYFMQHLSNDISVPHIVEATIDLAHKLGFKVVAEGIEEKEAADILKDLGADYAQGFYFAKPIHQDEILTFIKDYKSSKEKLKK